jgi:hypothetical protein
LLPYILVMRSNNQATAVSRFLRHHIVTTPPNYLIPEQTKTSKIVQYVSIAVTIIVTIRAMRYLDAKRAAVAPEIVYARRKRRQARLQAEANLAYTSPSALESGLSISPIRPENRPSGSTIHAPRPSYGQQRSTDVLFPQPTHYPPRSG